MKDRERYRTLGVIERFAISVGFLVLGLVITKTLAALLLTLLLLLTLKLQAVSWQSLFHFLRIPLTFAFLGLLSIVLVLGADTPNTLWVISRHYLPLSITVESLQMAEIVLWRVLNTLLALYFLIATTTPKEKNALADKLHIPKSLVELGILSFRYIQLLDKRQREIRMAQRLRLGYASYRKSFRSVVLLLSTVFVHSIITFRMNHQALRTRGYTGVLHYTDTKVFPKDSVWFVVMIFVIVVCVLIFYKSYVL